MLARDSATCDIWIRAFGKELGGLAQSDETAGTKGTNIIVFIVHDGIRAIPKYRIITYACIVVDHRPQKKTPTESGSQSEIISSPILEN